MKKIMFLAFVFVLPILGTDNNPLDPQNFRSLTDQEILNQSGAGNDLKIKNFYMNLDENEIKEVQKRNQELKEIFDQFDENLVNYKPLTKPISTMDKITTHPYFTTTILLPTGSVISSIDMSVEPITLKFEQNTILLRVKKDFTIANLAVIYSLDKKNYVANFLVEKYDRSKSDEKLNIVIEYKNIQKRDDLEVLSTYMKTYGDCPKEKYSYILIDGISYRIIKDNKNGNLFVNNEKYRVDIGNQF